MTSLTKLMAGVDWSQMRLNDWGWVRSGGDCPLQMLYGGSGYEFRARRQGYSQKQIDTIKYAADAHPQWAAEVRWRQWMLEQIAASEGRG